MRIGLKLHHEPFVVVEFPDKIQLVQSHVGAPDVRLRGLADRPLEWLHRWTRKNQYGCRVVDSDGFTGETHVVMGVFGHKKIHGIPGPTDLLPGQS